MASLKEIGYEVFCWLHFEIKMRTHETMKNIEISAVAFVNQSSLSEVDDEVRSERVEVKAECSIDFTHQQNGVPAVACTIYCCQAVSSKQSTLDNTAYFDIHVANLLVNFSTFSTPRFESVEMTDRTDSDLLDKMTFQEIKRCTRNEEAFSLKLVRH